MTCFRPPNLDCYGSFSTFMTPVRLMLDMPKFSLIESSMNIEGIELWKGSVESGFPITT